MSSCTCTTPAASRSARRWTRTAMLATVAAGVLTLAAACSAEDRRDLGEEDVRTSLTDQVTAAVESAGHDLDGNLDCRATIGTDGDLTAECSGTTDTGAAVSGSYTGSADVDAETCTARLVTTVGNEPTVDRAAVDCFAAD